MGYLFAAMKHIKKAAKHCVGIKCCEGKDSSNKEDSAKGNASNASSNNSSKVGM